METFATEWIDVVSNSDSYCLADPSPGRQDRPPDDAAIEEEEDDEDDENLEDEE
jgi:hypothetical protein